VASTDESTKRQNPKEQHNQVGGKQEMDESDGYTPDPVATSQDELIAILSNQQFSKPDIIASDRKRLYVSARGCFNTMRLKCCQNGKR
jgi:hypothetical protein